MPTRLHRASRRAIALAVAVLALAVAGVTGLVALAQSATGAAGPHAASPVALRSQGDGLQEQFVQVVRAVSPEVVQIQSGSAPGSGAGSDGRGDVLTSAPVVPGVSRFAVVRLPAGRAAPATRG